MDDVASRLVTILFTDVEQSTRRWEEDAETMDAALARHDAILRAEIARSHGAVAKFMGDGVLAVFDHPADAVTAAVNVQVALAAEQWSGKPLRVRMGIHTGEVRVRGGDVFGPNVNLAARIQGAAHGGQILLSANTELLVRDSLPPETSTIDLGHWVLRNIHAPQHLLEVRHDSLTSGFRRPRASRPGRSSLPVFTSVFIDLRGDSDRLASTLATARLVTVVGPGGVGKSRLAVEVATRAEETYVDGARWCPLADVDDPSLVGAAVASHLDLGGAATNTDDVLGKLGRRHLLLLIDNCEHVRSAVTTLVGRVLRECPDVTVLATSREPLRIAGERVLELAPLTGRHEGTDPAVTLFVERADAAGANLDLTTANRRRIAALCERLDGLPLAIELAAARSRSMSIDEIARRLDHRFQLLTSPAAPDASAPAHHRKLHDTVAWSYDLLDERERLLFERLAVFRGGLTADAAEAVCGDVGTWESLAELSERSLIQPDVGSPVTRYELLETVRTFALERLTERGEEAACAERHARYFCAFAEQADVERAGPNEAEWVDRDLAEMANFRAATMWALEHADIETALRLYVALYELASLQGRVEIFDWLDPTAYVDVASDLVPAALAMAGLRQDPSKPASVELAESAIALQAERGGRSHRIVPWAKGFAEASRQNRAAAVDAYREAVDLVRQLEGENGHWISARALVAMITRDAAEAHKVALDARRVGQPSGMANALLAVARTTPPHEADRALHLIRRAYGLAESVQNLRLLVYADLTAAGIANRDATPDVALTHLLAALGHAVEARHHEPMWTAVMRIGAALRRAGLDQSADTIIGAWIEAFPDAAARSPMLADERPFGLRGDPLLTAGSVLASERELCDRTVTIVDQLRRDGLLSRATSSDLAEERRAIGT